MEKDIFSDTDLNVSASAVSGERPLRHSNTSEMPKRNDAYIRYLSHGTFPVTNELSQW